MTEGGTHVCNRNLTQTLNWCTEKSLQDLDFRDESVSVLTMEDRDLSYRTHFIRDPLPVALRVWGPDLNRHGCQYADQIYRTLPILEGKRLPEQAAPSKCKKHIWPESAKLSADLW